MTEGPKPIPSFNNPPIVEKLMGIQFQPIQGWSIPHFGLFWQEIREDFPRFLIKPPLTRGQSELSVDDLIRCWFYQEPEAKLIQVQKDCFFYNWQKPTAYAEYPHYEKIKPKFIKMWEKFCDFLAKENLGIPVIEGCEITYIDHLEKGREWKSLSDLSSVINGWSGFSGELLHTEPDTITLQISYSLPDIEGNLSILLQPAFRSEDSKEIFQLQITVVGKPSSQNLEDILLWFDIARDYVVKGFLDFTNKKMHELWGIKN
jgi:uncharacterized protein (TIGR04255 family)